MAGLTELVVVSEWQKSELQIKMERDGWEFLLNHAFNGTLQDITTRSNLIVNLMKNYEEIVFKPAYDSKGVLIRDMQGVYVKGRINSKYRNR